MCFQLNFYTKALILNIHESESELFRFDWILPGRPPGLHSMRLTQNEIVFNCIFKERHQFLSVLIRAQTCLIFNRICKETHRVWTFDFRLRIGFLSFDLLMEFIYFEQSCLALRDNLFLVRIIKYKHWLWPVTSLA